MPENTTTATGFQNRILEAVPNMNRNYAKQVAYRLKRRMDFDTRWVGASEEVIYEEGLRILGIITDSTARDSVKRIELQDMIARHKERNALRDNMRTVTA